MAGDCANIISRQLPLTGHHQCARLAESPASGFPYRQCIGLLTLTLGLVASALIQAPPTALIVRVVSGSERLSDLRSNSSNANIFVVVVAIRQSRTHNAIV